MKKNTRREKDAGRLFSCESGSKLAVNLPRNSSGRERHWVDV